MKISREGLDRYQVLSEEHINIFFAGGSFTRVDMLEWGVRKQLISWYHDKDNRQVRSYEGSDDHFLILDSGAFSAWQQGIQIDIKAYAEDIVKLGNTIGIAANLDVIPGRKGMKATDITDAIKKDAAESGWRNYLFILEVLKANGREDLCSRVMPIHHQGESLDILKRMVDFGCEYIGISPSNDYTTRQRMVYLDEVYQYLDSLSKRIWTHGYAVTSSKLMEAYPWFSVDSISWIAKAGFGIVATPFGEFCFSDDPRSLKVKNNLQIVVDSETGEWRINNSQFCKNEDLIYQYLEEELMMRPLDLAREYQTRAHANVIFLMGYERDYQLKGRHYHHANDNMLFS